MINDAQKIITEYWNKRFSKYWNGNPPPSIDDCLVHPFYSAYMILKDLHTPISSKYGKQIFGIPIKPLKMHLDKSGYYKIHIRYDGKHHSMSYCRFKWECHNGLIPKGMMLDHIDRNTLNNDFTNLRLVNRADNNHNRMKKNGCSSQYIGVSWFAHYDKWLARTSIAGKRHHIGYFDNELEAARAYDDFCISIGRLPLNTRITKEEK